MTSDPLGKTESVRDDGRDTPTAAQRSQWLVERVRPGFRGYLIPLMIEVPRGTTWAALSRAFSRLVEAHPALRSAVRSVDDGADELRVERSAASRVVVLEPRPVQTVNEAAVLGIIDGIADQLPSIEHARPWRLFGLTRDGEIAGVLWLMHHAVMDDPSVDVLIEDLKILLDGGQIEDERPIPSAIGTPPDPMELAARLREDMEGVPVGFGWTRQSGGRSRRLVRTLDPAEVARVDGQLREQGATRAAAILAAVRRAARILGAPDHGPFPISVPVSLRDRPGLERTVGMFLNTLPIPVCDADDLQTIAGRLWNVRRLRHLPYEVAASGVERLDSRRAPWLDLTVGIVEKPDDRPRALAAHTTFSGDATFPVFVLARFHRGLHLEIDVDGDWVGDEAEAFADAVRQALLDTGATDGEAFTQKRSVLEGRPRDAPIRSLPALVEDQLSRGGDRIAVEDVNGTALTYDRLWEISGGLAGRLAASGRPISRPVAILARPGAAFPIAVLAVMRAGGAAMPLPVEAPVARLAELCRRARPAALLVADDESEAIGARVAVELGETPPMLKILDPLHHGIDPPRFDVDPEADCYVLFTSGSTGEPKAVRMHHAGLAGLMMHEEARSEPGVARRTAQLAPLGFDVAFQELFSTWTLGGTLVPVPWEVRRDPIQLLRFVDEHGITRIHVPPIVLRAICAACRDGLPESLQECIAAGEALRIDDAIRRAIKASGHPVRITNQYGPTETHVVTDLTLEGDPAGWPDLPSIGRPITGAMISIESEAGDPVPIGDVGEIVVAGECVARGYLDGEPGGFKLEACGRRYRTGDLGRCGSGGQIEYLGRRDEQVKISGYRVEPGEVEAIITDLIGVRDAGVVAVRIAAEWRLVGFVEADGTSITGTDLHDQARELLPPWMVPESIELVESLPRTTNGKLDRRRLRERAITSIESIRSRETGVDAIIERLRASETDGGATPNRDRRSLAELGVDSLRAIELQLRIRKTFGVNVPVADILASTVTQLRSRMPGRHPEDALSVLSTFGAVNEAPRSRRSHSGVEWTPLDPLVRDVLAEDALAPPGAFHLAWTLHFTDRLPLADVRARLLRIIKRFPTLRTCRDARRGARVLPFETGMVLPIEEFPGPPALEERRRILRHPLRVAAGEPWRVATWNGPRGREVLIVLHHAAVDGRTARIILDDLAEFEETERSFVEPDPVDSSSLDDDRWWVERVRSELDDVSLPRVDFDADQESVSVVDDHAGLLFRHVADRAAAHGLPPVAPAVAAWGLVLARASGRSGAVIGVPFATDASEAGLGASILPVPI
ncbi:MAG: hypothetical protein RLZZ461_1337, partial [Planctomycetota bacterium]